MQWKRVLYAFFLVVVAGASALSGAVAGGVAVYRAMQSETPHNAALPQPSSATQQITEQKIVTTDISTAITDAVEKVGPAVVTVVGVVPGQVTFFGRTSDQTVSGSGVFISSDGYVITNNHVVEDTAEISLILADGSEMPATLVGRDPFSDVAVLKAEGTPPAVATLGNSDNLRPGETVIAIGSPLGDFKNTVTVGVISATERAIEVDQNRLMEGLIQTDAAINQGNSGGPLVNLAGEVIGINTLIVRGGGYGSAVAEGLGFAIPSNKVRAVAEQLIANGRMVYPYLGIRYQWISPAIARNYNLPVESGVYVARVAPNTPAEKAGLRPGDIITHIGEQKLDADHPFINVLYSFAPGETTTLTVVRDGKTLTLEVTFAAQPSN
ncbi:MAG: PDZ domain-containing protein [Anaerolineae bacterium]|nr:MAG: PDZ domain-containing protein [Anaerolineae bacterium]